MTSSTEDSITRVSSSSSAALEAEIKLAADRDHARPTFVTDLYAEVALHAGASLLI